MTHAAMTDEARQQAGIEFTLLRLSVGIEHVADLIVDISTGLECAQKAAVSAIKIARYA
jgi:cystathionine beta-lyase/cystathionine gamma-synthase